jgi:hypothetical protein
MSAVALNFPAGQKIIGVNLGIPLAANSYDATAQADYESRWVSWDDASGYYTYAKLNLERAAGCGCNVFRFLFPFTTISGALLTQAQAVDRCVQLIAYGRQLGMTGYPTLCIPSPDPDPNDAAVIAFGKALITGLRSPVDYLNWVLAIDVGNESQGAGLFSTCTAALRAYADTPAIWPISASWDGAHNVWDNNPFGKPATTFDFFDIHLYPNQGGHTFASPPTVSEILTGTDDPEYAGFEIFIGEFGVNSAAEFPADVQSWHENLWAVAFDSSSRIRGGMIWTAQDADAYGWFTTAGAAVSNKILPLLKSRGGALRAPTSLRQAPSGKIVWNPEGCSSSYATTRLYRDGVQINGSSIYGLYQDPTPIGTAYTYYEATAVTSTGTESARSAKLEFNVSSGLVGGTSRKKPKRKRGQTLRWLSDAEPEALVAQVAQVEPQPRPRPIAKEKSEAPSPRLADEIARVAAETASSDISDVIVIGEPAPLPAGQADTQEQSFKRIISDVRGTVDALRSIMAGYVVAVGVVVAFYMNTADAIDD